MEQQLLKVAAAEHIDLTADGAELLARMANGALRDALSLLDQCRAAAGVIDAPAVLDTLGLAGSTQTLQLQRLLLSRQSGDALALLDQLYRGGKDVAALLGETQRPVPGYDGDEGRAGGAAQLSSAACTTARP